MSDTEREPIKSVLLRLKPEDADRLEDLSGRVTWTSRSAVALAALRVGLAALERDPALMLDPDAMAPPEGPPGGSKAGPPPKRRKGR